MKNYQIIKQQGKEARIRRVRAKVTGTAKRPRVAIFRSLNHIYVQFIDDTKGKTLVAVSDFDIKSKKNLKKVEVAKEVGMLAAEQAIKAKIKQVVFDRRSYKYHGRLRALAESMRAKGIKF